MTTPPRPAAPRPRGLAPVVLVLLALSACGGGGALPVPEPFVVTFPADPAGGGGTPPPPLPPPAPPSTPVFDPDAFVHGRTLPFGSFPSDVVVYQGTVFTTDADEIDADGALVVPLDVSAGVPVPSTRFAPCRVTAADLVDSDGNPASLAAPIGYGFFLGNLEIVTDHLGFVLVNAGGVDSTPALANLVAFDPSTGRILQVVDLARSYVFSGALADSAGQAIPGPSFRQAGAEALAFVPTLAGRGLLYVALTNFTLGSYGVVKLPGTLQVFDVSTTAPAPVQALPTGGQSTWTIRLDGFNPVGLALLEPASGSSTPRRLLVTVAGATTYDAAFRLVPSTDAFVEVLAAPTGTRLGRFVLGKVGLSPARAALGRDAAGHRVGFFPSAVTGEVYLLRLDGLYVEPVDPTQVAVLRGPLNGIPITAAQSGQPGGNITGVLFAPDGRTLLVAGFGDLFAAPAPLPGRLFLLSLPDDVVSGSGFGTDFVPGSALLGTAPGRTLGALALVAGAGGAPEVCVAVAGPIDATSFAGTGPASLGTLDTFGLLR